MQDHLDSTLDATAATEQPVEFILDALDLGRAGRIATLDCVTDSLPRVGERSICEVAARECASGGTGGRVNGRAGQREQRPGEPRGQRTGGDSEQ